MENISHKFVIGVDGGGTKTLAMVADLSGNIISEGQSGSSSPRNVGIDKSIENIIQAIDIAFLDLYGKGNVQAIVIGLASLAEEYQDKSEIIENKIKNNLKTKGFLKGEVFVISDQIIAFHSEVDKKEGVVVISGTGCVARGWRDKKDIKASGWGWLSDEGSAFWVGQKVFQQTMKSIDGRSDKTILVKMIMKELNINNPIEYNRKVYMNDFTELIPYLSKIADEAAKKGDKFAKSIMNEAGKELALSTNTVIENLGFKKEFPIVLVGSMFKSKFLFDSFKKEIKKKNKFAKIIIPEKPPVFGAIKMAIKKINEKSKKN